MLPLHFSLPWREGVRGRGRGNSYGIVRQTIYAASLRGINPRPTYPPRPEIASADSASLAKTEGVIRIWYFDTVCDLVLEIWDFHFVALVLRIWDFASVGSCPRPSPFALIMVTSVTSPIPRYLQFRH